MGWLSGSKPDPKSNTISDRDWRNLQARAAKANPQKLRGGRDSERDAVRGKKAYDAAAKRRN